MSITAFAPLFLLMALYAALGARQWMAVTMIASFFQAASPLVVHTGSRVGGLTPAYLLLGIGCFHWLRAVSSGKRNDSSRALDAQTFWLAALVIIGVTGAVVLPRLFDGVMVMPPRGGLDTGFLQAVRLGSGNFIQAFYLLCNFLFFFLMAQFLTLRQFAVADCLVALKRAAILAIFLGIYQLISYHAELPWPGSIINSNAGVSQQYEQMFLGVRRMSATFLEPSQMAFYFVALFALFGLGLKQKWLATLLAICLVLSTSSSAYVGLICMFALWMAFEVRRNSLAVFSAMAAVAVAASVIAIVDVLVNDGRIIDALLLSKLSSVSGVSRAHADYMAFRAMFESYGFGVGIGSARASSLIATLAATMGIPGLLCFAGFIVVTLRRSFAATDEIGRALGYAMVAFLVVWIVSVPDLALPLPWLIAGIISGMARARATVAPSRSHPAELESLRYVPANI